MTEDINWTSEEAYQLLYNTTFSEYQGTNGGFSLTFSLGHLLKKENGACFVYIITQN